VGAGMHDPIMDAAQQLYWEMLDSAPWGVFHSTADGRYINVNRALAQLYGHDGQAEMMAAVTDIARQVYVDPGRRAEFLRRMRDDGAVASFESQIYRHDGSTTWVSESVRSVTDGAGNFLYFEGTVEDISGIKAREEEHRQREAGLRQLVNAIGVGISYWDRDLVCRFANDAHLDWAGMRPDELLGAHLEKLMGPERFAAQQAYRDAVFRGESVTFHLPLVTQSGKAVELQIVFTPDWRDGAVVGYYAVGMDVTELVRLESELGAREQQLRLLVDSVPVGISYWDPDLICRFANRQRFDWLAALNPDIRTIDDLVGKSAVEIFGSGRVAALAPHIAAVRAGKRTVFDVTETLPGGTHQHVQTIFAPELKDGRVVGFYAISVDFTDLKNIELTLRLSEARYREVFSHIADAIFLNEVMPDGRIRVLEVNPAAELQMGVRAADLLGRGPEEYLPPTTAALLNGHFRTCLESGEIHRFEIEIDVAAGHRVIHATFVPIRDDQGQVRRILGLGRDMTEARELEQAILSSQERERLAHGRLLDAIESLRDGFVLWGPDGRIQMLNRAVSERHFLAGQGYAIGMSYQEAYAQFVLAWRAVGLAPDQVRAMVAGPAPAGSTDGAARMTLGSSWLASFTGSSPELPTAYGRWLVIHRQATREGGFVEFWLDVTERRSRELELRAAWSEADSANRAKSRFLAQMSHELRTPLNAVIGFSDLMQRGIAGLMSPSQAEYCGHIYRSGSHLLQLVQGILDYAAIESDAVKVTLEPVDAAALLGETRELMQPIARKAGIDLMPANAGAVWVLTDTLRLRQILINLISNAVKYNRPGGEVRLAIARQPDERVRIVVADNGIGIPRERQSELFRPFERLGQEGSNVEGTGLGLVLVRRLAERINCSVGVESEAGKGSRFWVDLPAAAMPEKA
jgi:PAS domain S-box-containing protein